MDVFQAAAKAAQVRYGEVWSVMSPQEQTKSIYEEMRRIDEELLRSPERPARVRRGKRTTLAA